MLKPSQITLPALLALLLAAMPLPAAPAGSENVEAELIPEVKSIQPGSPFWVAVRLKMAPEWHTYWRYAGDAGLPTRVTWDLPEGFAAGPLHWPYPEALVVADIVNLGYEGEILLLSQISPPSALEQDRVTLRAAVDWLECKEMCIPGGAEVEARLPVSKDAPVLDPALKKQFAATRERLPLADSPWVVKAFPVDDMVRIEATPPDGLKHSIDRAVFYPHAYGQVLLGAPQEWKQEDGRYVLTTALDPNAEEMPAALSGILVSDAGWTEDGLRHALEVKTTLRPSSDDAITGSAAPAPGPTLFFFAFLGGLILNLMPCVFPVLGVKIMGFVNQAGEDRKRIKLHGLVFTLGVMISFWILAGILITLRAGGAELGWGFQLQSPRFVFALGVLLFVFALNLSGLFEIGTSLTGVGGKLAMRGGYAGSFFSGVLATVLATPCAAPILAPALGVALTLDAGGSLAVFSLIGLGLALPYLLLSVFPGLLRFLPKPGPWMETFKQLMSFLLYATVAYLVYVLAGQLEERAFLFTLFAFVLLAMACWVYGRWASPARSPAINRVATFAAALVLVSAVYLGFAAQTPSVLKWEPWSPETVEQLREVDQPVFIDFTARWCMTCQVNKDVLASDAVTAVLLEMNVATLKADWTNQDPAITRALAGYGRSAVPLYVYYAPGASAPAILPELLTPSIVLEALGRTS